MKVCTMYVFIALFAALCHAATLNEAIDPAIPRDKCGLTIGVSESEQLAIFVLGADRQFHYKYENSPDGGMSDWTSLGGNFKGGPAVVRSNDGRLEVFGRGSDNRIWNKYQASLPEFAFTEWTPLGSEKFTSDPVATLSSEGFIHLFAKGVDNSLMHKTQFTNNTLFVWTEWTSLGGALTSQPAVMLDAEGLLHVFVRGPDRALWRKYQIGGQEPRFVKWSEWQSLGGVLASAPRVPIALNTVNLLEIFVRASDKAYWHRTQVASLPPNDKEVDWNEWQSLGGVFSSGPSAVVNGDGLINAFGRGADKAIWAKSQVLEGGLPKWDKWISLKGITSTGPAVRVRSDGLIDVFARGVDKQIWKKTQIFSERTNATETIPTTFTVWSKVSNKLDGENAPFHSDQEVFTEAFAC